jgi:eukaryotic-like serine/threonine-protein kinase
MNCPSCQQPNTDEAEACFTCGMAMHALTHGAVLASRYVIRQPLGRGGMGHVYRAYDRTLEEDVAIKVIRSEFVKEPEMARRFRSEIRLARKVSHRNVCRIHEYGEERGLGFLSMEFVEGMELKRLLREGALSAAYAFDVAVQAAEGLQAVHAHGIVHRDLKPTNIMVDRRGVVRLMDFGIAKEAETEAGLTGSGQLMGTPEYMSPEQARGEKVGYASDVYALGCVVYEMFTGRPPFRADTPLNTLYMHVHDPPPLDDVRLPTALGPVLRRALAKDPAVRHGAAELADALRHAAAAERVPPVDLSALVTGVAGEVSLRAGGHLLGGGTGSMVTTTLGGAAGEAPSLGLPTLRESRRWRWAFAALSAAAGAVFVLGTLQSRAPEEPPAPSPALSPAPAVAPPAPVSPAAASPRPSEAPAPSPRATPRASVRPSPAPAVPAPSTSSPPVAVAPPPPSPALGTLSLVIVPPAEVTVDGTTLGTVSLREVPLAPGPHAVRVLHPDYKPLQRKVVIDAGRTERLVLDLGEKGIPRRGAASPLP